MRIKLLKEVKDALKGPKGREIQASIKRRGEERCIHRHTKKTHPNCFRRGEKFLLKNQQLWYEGLTMGFIDIETSDFKANAGFMTSWAIKYRNGPVKSAVITRREILNGTFDKRLVRELINELHNLDIIVTYYGTRFDVPYMRSRALYWGYIFPAYGSIYHFDAYYRARALLQIHKNTLDAVTRFLGIDGKTHLHIDEWFAARYGDAKILKEVLDHNIADVEILEDLFTILEPFSKWTRRSI